MHYRFFDAASFCLLSSFSISVSNWRFAALASASFCRTVGDWRFAAIASASFCRTLGDWRFAALASASFCRTISDWRLAALASTSFWHLLQKWKWIFNSGSGNKDVYSVTIPFLSGLYSFKFSFLLLSNFKRTLQVALFWDPWHYWVQHVQLACKTLNFYESTWTAELLTTFTYTELEHAQSHQHVTCQWSGCGR